MATIHGTMKYYQAMLCKVQIVALAMCLFPVSSSQSPDCKSLPRSMNGGSKPRGCPGAVYQNGKPSWKYCAGLGNSGSSVKYPWWKKMLRLHCRQMHTETRLLDTAPLNEWRSSVCPPGGPGKLVP